MGGAAMTEIDRVCEAELVKGTVLGDERARQAVEMHRAACGHAAAAVFCAAASGAAMLMKKQELGHGNGFTEWKESLDMPARTCDRYMALAREMAERLSGPYYEVAGGDPIAMLAGADPDELNEENRMVRRAVQEVTSGYSLTQLYFDWGIVKDRRKEDIKRVHPDIDHGGDGRSPEQHQWDRIKSELLDAMTRKTYAGLDHAELQDAKDTLYDAYNEVLECWKRG